MSIIRNISTIEQNNRRVTNKFKAYVTPSIITSQSTVCEGPSIITLIDRTPCMNTTGYEPYRPFNLELNAEFNFGNIPLYKIPDLKFFWYLEPLDFNNPFDLKGYTSVQYAWTQLTNEEKIITFIIVANCYDNLTNDNVQSLFTLKMADLNLTHTYVTTPTKK